MYQADKMQKQILIEIELIFVLTNGNDDTIILELSGKLLCKICCSFQH